MNPNRPLTVAVQAALDPRAAGGVQTNLLSLVRNMARLRNEVLLRLLVPEIIADAWREAADPAFAVDRWPFPLAWYRDSAPPTLKTRLKALIARDRPSGAAEHDAELRRLGCDLVHFPYQLAFDTALPSLYEPWDLQHVRLPHLFSEGERRWRTQHYGRACARAAFVVTATAATKRDVMEVFGVPAERIAVVYRDTSLTAVPRPLEERRAALDRLGISGPYAFYPAMTYAHKNHLRLVEALAIAKQRHGLVIPLVLSGRPMATDADVRKRAADLGIAGQVMFVGAVSEQDLADLYAEARLLAFPSRFEGLGLPLLEAMQYGVPIAAAQASCIPEVCGAAAMTFDPDSPDAMAETLASLWEDGHARNNLVQCGYNQRKTFDWTKAAEVYHSLYLAVAGRPRDAAQSALVAEALSLG